MLLEVGSQFNWYDYLSKFGLVENNKHKRKKNKQRILNVISAFDIETSTIWLNPDKSLYNVHSFMYTWQMQIEEHTIKGRTWEEFFKFLDILKTAIHQIGKDNKLSENPLLVLWVHNLAYEWQFLSGLYPFTNEECFFRSARKPIYCRMFKTFELRCSYIQTNLSLSALCKQTGVAEKLSGQKYDYDKIRFPWTELTPFEQEYCTRDVKSLVEAMRYRISRGGDNLVTVPLTSTGYVRRECKNALADYFLDLREMKPDKEMYRLLRDSFRGGNTHCSRFWTGQIVEDVYSYDIASSYPTQQLTHTFPMKQFKWLGLNDNDPAERIKRVFNFIGLGYAVVGKYKFKAIRLRDKREPIPYISLARCKATGFVLDNGRILDADYLEINLTEIDLKIIVKQYEFDEIDVEKAMVARKGMLPQVYRNVIQDYFNKKTLLKGDNTEDGKYMYVKSKNMLNSVYGMTATDPIHREVIYDPEHTSEKAHIDDFYNTDYSDFSEEEIEKLLKNAPFPYQWGCYTTALARLQLEMVIDECKKQGKRDDILYCDTDSIKVRGKLDLTAINEALKESAIKFNAFADDKNGNRHYIGLFEFDGHYDQFIAQGAKRYAYLDGKCKYKDCPNYEKCSMHITVSGVQSTKINEETGFPFAVEELGSLSNFHPDIRENTEVVKRNGQWVLTGGDLIKKGIVWSKAGGTMSVYNDHADITYTDPVSGRTIHITKNVAIIPTTYEMMYSRDYSLLLHDIQLYGEYQKERS